MARASLIPVLLLLPLALGPQACGGEAGVTPVAHTVARGLGVPVDGAPSYTERTAHHQTNRVRAGYDYGNESLACALVLPLAWDATTARASRFQAQHLHDSECFQHDSCCTLEEVEGVVQCDAAGVTCPEGSACAMHTECAGTSWSTRVGMFGGYAYAENIAAGGYTAEAAIQQWYNSPGHHANMCNGSFSGLGLGHHDGSNCFGSYWVQNFNGSGPQPGPVSGSHWPSGGGTSFGASFYWPAASGPPRRAAAVVDDACAEMARELGDDRIGLYAVELAPGDGCHAYWFLFEAEDGQRFTYPSEGSFLMGASCDAIYQPGRGGADCEGGVVVEHPLDVGSALPDAAQPDTTRRDAPQPDSARVDAAQPDTAGSDAIQPDRAGRDVAETSDSGGADHDAAGPAADAGAGDPDGATAKADKAASASPSLGQGMQCGAAAVPPAFAWALLLLGLRRMRAGHERR